jgi:hypothetical protein
MGITYELLFSFSNPEEKDQFLELVRSNTARSRAHFTPSCDEMTTVSS